MARASHGPGARPSWDPFGARLPSRKGRWQRKGPEGKETEAGSPVGGAPEPGRGRGGRRGKDAENLTVSRSVVSDSAIPWTAARQAPLSTGLSRQEYWSGFHFLLQGIFPTRDRTHISYISSIGRQVLYTSAIREALRELEEMGNRGSAEGWDGRED